MKKNKFTLPVISVAVLGISLSAAVYFVANKSSYIPRSGDMAQNFEKGISGAAEYYYNLRKNPLTGELDYDAMLAAEKEVRKMLAERSAAALNIEWHEMGPDNVGGRTRAFIIDRNNPEKLFAGGVAGGLWVSTNGGGMWSKINDQQENLAISCLTMAANGDIYYGTGEGFAQPSGHNFNSGTIGRGVFKSTDGGATFTQLSSTDPSDGNSTSVDWSTVYRIEAHPTNSSIIYAGTNRGLRVTIDGGENWDEAYITLSNGNPATGTLRDIDISKDGTVLVNLNNKAYVSPDGSKGSFEEKTTGTGLAGAGSVTRIEFAISASNSNVMYAAAAKTNGQLLNVYYSDDKGDSWTVIGPGGGSFDPFGSNGQGWYDNIIAVNPFDEGELLFGGVELWRWKRVQTSPVAGQWTQTAAEFPDSPQNPVYVHSDKHNIVWHPTDPKTVYVLTDGGVSKSTDGGYMHKPMNKNYNILQCYSVAFSGTGEVMAGSQDNGTQYINFKGNSPFAANEVSGGDGMHCEISQIDRNILFSTIYNAETLSRTKGNTASGNFYTSALDSAVKTYGAAFVTPIALWESFDDPNSPDSVLLVAKRVNHNFSSPGNGTIKSFTDTLKPAHTAAEVVPGSIVVTSLSQVLTDDGAGKMKDGSGSDVGTVDYDNKLITVNFPVAPPTNVAIKVEFDVRYESGSEVAISSNTGAYPIDYTLTSDLESGDSVKIHDRVQSKLALGLSGSVWITKRALDFGSESHWIKVASINGTVQHMQFTSDGEHLFVGTQGGSLYRISGLSVLVDEMETKYSNSAAESSVTVTQINPGSFSGRSLTDIAVDPNNNDHVIVTLGNYGTSTYIYRSTDATSSSPTFTSRQGALTKMPIYTAVIEKRGNSKKVIIGTEYGIYATEDITASSPVWVSENTGFPPVPVFMMRQQTHDNNFYTNVYNDGNIYVGTHGRGIWQTETFKGPAGIKDPNSKNTIAKTSALKVYPNPISENGKLGLNLTKAADNVSARFYDINGRLIKEIKLQNLASGEQFVPFNASEMNSGTYFVKVTGNGVNLSTKFVVLK